MNHNDFSLNQGECDPQVSHIQPPDLTITKSNHSKNRYHNCDPRLSHKRSIRGLWRRGSVYQFRMRVPHDLRDKVQQDHVNRSLKTDSLSLAMRLARKIGAEIEAMFEDIRRHHGLPHVARLLSNNSGGETVLAAIPARPPTIVQAPVQPYISPTPALDLATLYERFLSDPTKRRSARTLLAHQTTCRVVKEVLGADTLVTSISRENCRELLDILRWLPVNHSKKYPKLTVRQAAARAKADRVSIGVQS